MPEDLRGEGTRIRMLRVKCRHCGHMHAILPEEIAPYLPFGTVFYPVQHQFCEKKETLGMICRNFKSLLRSVTVLYVFQDAGKEAAGEVSYLANAEKKGTFSQESYAEKEEAFGVIVLESDQKIEAKSYSKNFMMRSVKTLCQSDRCDIIAGRRVNQPIIIQTPTSAVFKTR